MIRTMWALVVGVLGVVHSSGASAQRVFREYPIDARPDAYVWEDGIGSGIAIADYDGDGWLDIYVPQAEGVPNLLFHNVGGGVFEEVAQQLGIEHLATSRVAL